MGERPISFRGDMVRALLDGRKTQTRRVVKPQPERIRDWSAPGRDGWRFPGITVADGSAVSGEDVVHCRPRYCRGDLLWVRETFATTQHGNPVYRADARDGLGHRWTSFEPGDPKREVRWRPPRFMPKLHARLWLRVTDVRVERVQDITEEDAWAEGYPPHGTSRHPREARDWFAGVWDDLHGAGAWEHAPWVEVYMFERVRP